MKTGGAKCRAAVFLLFAIILSMGTLPVWGGGFEHTTNGPYGGVIQAMTIGSNGTVYASAYQGWLFTSTDAGANWDRSKLGIPNSGRNIQTLAAASTGAVYAGSLGGGVFRTTNGGTSWTAINTGLTNLYVLSLLVDTSTPTTVYAGTNGSGVFEWQGSTWTAKNAGATTAIVPALAMTGDGTLYLGRQDDGTNYGVYYWDGDDWQPRNTGLPANTTIHALLAAGTNLWAGTEGQGVYYWNGSTWSARNTGLPEGSARDVWSLGTDGTGQVYCGTADGFYAWTGTQWELRTTGLEGNGRYIRAMVSPGDSTLYIGTSGRGVYKTPDGGANWTDANEGLSGHVVRAVAINPQYDWRVYAGTYRGGVFWSTNGGMSWNWWSEGLGDVEVTSLAVTYPDGDPIYAGLNGQGVYRRDRIDQFNQWEDWAAKNTGLSGNALAVNAVLIKPNNSPVVFAGTEAGVYKTLSSGDSWFYSSVGLPYAVTALAVHPLNWDTIYAGTRLNGVYVSYDDGGQWVALPGLSSDAAKIFALALDTSGILYAGTADGVYRYASSSWQADGLQDTEIHTLATNPLSATVVFAGAAEGTSPIGVVKKTPQGWEPMNFGLENTNVYALSIDDYYTQTLHTGTGGASVWDYTFADDLPEMSPEMGINLDDGISTVHLGDLLTYTLAYYNAGVVDATNVVISMTLPNNSIYVSSNPPFHQEQPGIYWLDLPFVELESEASVQFIVRLSIDPPYPTTIDAEASIWDDGGSGPDPFLFNNQDEDIDTVEYGDLAITVSKEADPPAGSTVEPGDLITYTIRYENLGFLPVTQAVLTDTYDPQGDYTIISTNPAPSHGNNIWDVGTLGHGDDGTIEIVVELEDVLPDNWPVSNVASLGCAEGGPVDSETVLHNVMNPPGTARVGLSVDDIYWVPAEPGMGDLTTFYATISNQGTADASDPFWVELYIKPVPSSPPEAASDHDYGYCLNDCTILRPNYVRLIAYMNAGQPAFDVPFSGSDIFLPHSGCFDIYAQVDVAFDAPGFNPFWGLYPEDDEFDNVWHEELCIESGPPWAYLPFILKRH